MADAFANEIAWAAGLFEGEGCICVGIQRGRWPRIVLSLGMTDRDVVERFAAVIGVGPVYTRKRQSDRHHTMYVWTIAGRQVAPVLELLMPWLGERRSTKAQQALEMLAAIGPRNGEKTHCPQNHPYDVENTAYRSKDGSRRCKACENRRNRERVSRAR